MRSTKSTDTAGPRPAASGATGSGETDGPAKAVEVRGLSKSYPSKSRTAPAAVADVGFDVAAGELLVLLGPSGCGKTTILRCVAGILRPTSGQVRVAGRTVFDTAERINVPPHKRDLGMVFQSFALWPHMTVAQNVAYPLRARRMSRSDRNARVAEVLRLVQCDPYADRLPGGLSGGQQQRVALARALAASPSLMLFDEPLSNLDAALRLDLRNQLRDLHQSLGFSGIYVTHDQAEAVALGTRVAVMRSGQIEQVGPPPEVFANPVSPDLARFLGMKNDLELVRQDGRWVTKDGRAARYIPQVADDADGPIQLTVRAEDLHLVPVEGLAQLPEPLRPFATGTLTRVISGGAVREYVVQLGDGTRLDVRGRVGPALAVEGAEVGVAIGAGAEAVYQADKLIRSRGEHHG